MKHRETESGYVIVLEKGEKVREKLTEFCEEHQVCGFFHGLGSIEEPELAYYSLEDEEYHSERQKGIYEVTNMTGNTALVDGERFVHAHVTLGNPDYEAVAGHLVEGTVGATLEIFFTPTEDFEREYDEEVDLDLISP